MKIMLMIPAILLFSCGRLSNEINPEFMKVSSMEDPVMKEEEIAATEEDQPPASADALPDENPKAAAGIPATEPEESTERQDCRRFLEPQESGVPSSALNRSKLGRFHVSLEWSENLIAGELSNHARIQFLDLNHQPIPLTLISFELFMPSMNHGTIKLDKLIFTQNPDSRHAWKVDQIYFSMPGNSGEWVVDSKAGICGASDTIRVPIEHAVIDPE